MTAHTGSIRWVLFACIVSAATAILVLGGALTDLGPWYQRLKMPPWKPPDWLFAPVWSTIFALWTVAVYLAWRRTPTPSGRGWLIACLAANAVFNVLWSALFFKLRHPDWALIEVLFFWLSIVLLIGLLGRASRVAGLLLVPYLAWVSLAGILNLSIVRLNYSMLTGEPGSK